MKNVFYLHGCIFILILSACSSQKSNTTSDNNNAQNMPLKTDEILFINMKMEVKNAKDKSISLINTVKSTGKLKASPPQLSPQKNDTFLTCSLLNSQKKKVDEITIEHPLLRDLESYEEDGTVKQNAVSVPSAEFSIRVQNNYDAQYIVIKEVIKGKISQQSYTINLYDSK
jgi:hypothetical protein